MTEKEREALASILHDIYIKEAKRQGDVRHKDRYEDLSENIKDFDRVLADFILARDTELREINDAKWRKVLANEIVEDRKKRTVTAVVLWEGPTGSNHKYIGCSSCKGYLGRNHGNYCQTCGGIITTNDVTQEGVPILDTPAFIKRT